MEVPQYLLAAFGNPLWDVCVSLPDDGVLSKFGLADDSSKEVTAAEYESLRSAVQRFPQEGCAGGAALNTLRIFQWLVGAKNSSVFFGGIGCDETGKQLVNKVFQAGVNGRFKFHQHLLTGTTICLIYNNMRTLIAHLGAADVFSQEDLTDEDKNILAQVKLMYIENFFFCHSPGVIWNVVEICKNHGVAIAFNLSGSYLFEKHGVNITLLVKCVNILVGNESEYLAFAKSCNWTDKEPNQLSAVATKICNEGIQNPPFLSCETSNTPKLENVQNIGKVVVITRGHRPVICLGQKVPLFETTVLQPNSGIKDTTGAGDAFAAGLLMGIMQNIPIDMCIQLGCYASSEIIQQIGCNPPKRMPIAMEEITERFTTKSKRGENEKKGEQPDKNLG